MKDYLIWAGERLESVTGWDWEKCMDYLTSSRSRFARSTWLSIESYLRENHS